MPHPLNRGGDPVKVLRCRSITRDIATHGCDVSEAQHNAVLIETPPDQEAAASVRLACGYNPDFDAHFAEHALDANDMCIKHGVPIEGASVSHSHLNCSLRNVQTGKVGCECSEKVRCTCGNGCICDDNGRYSMEKSGNVIVSGRR